jgi:transglutaminase-like putative cysteine protease
MMRNLFIGLLVFVLPTIGLAEESTPAELETRYKRYHITYTVNDDHTHVTQHDWAMKVLTERAVEYAKRTSISYSTSIEKAEIIAAYTQKADGRRIDAPKTNFQVKTNKGKDKNAPVFSDRTTLTVVFPEVEVGDTLVFTYKVTQSEAMFPGHFTAAGVFPRNYAYDDVRIRLDVPASLKAQHQVRQMSEKVSRENGRQVYEWRYQHTTPMKNERRNYSVWNEEAEPGYAYSTFESYEAIAKVYGERALPKAVVTEQVSKLADEIVGDITEPREQARLLYEWVATNISYAGNCIGVGAVVPHDIPFVLDNRMGDCKDHATLLQALLAAKGIQSTQALVNAGSRYTLPEVPQVSAVNHVINYLPEFDLFVDSTDQTMPFGMLAFVVSDKPVLLVEGYRQEMKTPVPPVGSNRQTMKTVVHIQPDGSAKGEIEVDLKGLFAVATRAQLRHITREQEEEMIKNVFRSEGHFGKGKFDKDDPKDLRDTYSYKVSFEKKGFIQRPGAGAFYVSPLFPSNVSVYHFVNSALSPMEKVDVACSNGLSIEEYTYIFPKDMRVLAKPEDLSIDGKYLSYKATYKVEDNALKVRRVVDDKAPGNICPPELMQSQREVGLKVVQNLKSQVVYQ